MDLYGEITFTMCQFVFEVSQIWIVSWSHLVAECYFKAFAVQLISSTKRAGVQ